MNKATLLTFTVIVPLLTVSSALATTSSSSLKSSKKIEAPKGTINILSATYGGNCTKKSVKGNATSHIKLKCNGKTACDYKVDPGLIGDPFYGCAKNYVVEYSCGSKSMQAELPAEASSQLNPLSLVCEDNKSSTSKTKSTSKSGGE